MVKSLLLSVIIAIFSMFGFSQTNISTGSVSGVWSEANSPYMIQGNIQVDSFSTLTIEPGVEILFEGYYGIMVKGSLIAEGNLSDSIIFNIVDTTGFADTTLIGAWKGITFWEQDSSEVGILKFCKLSHIKTKVPMSWEWTNAEIEFFNLNSDSLLFDSGIKILRGHNIAISNSELAYIKGKTDYPLSQGSVHGGAISVLESHADITENHIHDCEQTSAILFGSNSSGLISHNELNNNWNHNGAGIALYSSYNPIEVSYNNIYNNSATFHDGGGIFVLANCNPLIKNNIIYGNSAQDSGAGIALKEYSGGRIISNLIANNFIDGGACGFTGGGAGIRIGRSFDTIVYLENNIIVNNSIPNFNGAGIYSYLSSIVVYNNLIANNLAQTGAGIFLFEDSSSVFVNCIIEGNQATNEGNELGFYNYTGQPSCSFLNCVVPSLFSNLYSSPPIVFFDTTNIFSYSPNFISPSLGVGTNYSGLNANWHPNNSDLIDSGILPLLPHVMYPLDYEETSRVQGVAIDIGPYEEGDALKVLDSGAKVLIPQLYPNPNKGQFVIRDFEEQLEKVILSNLQDRFLEINWYQIGKEIFFTSDNLNPGIYYLKLILKNGTSSTIQFIIV